MTDLNRLYLEAEATVKEFTKKNSISWSIKGNSLLSVLLCNYIALAVASQLKECEFLSSVISTQEKLEAAILGDRLFSRKQLNSLEDSLARTIKASVPALSKKTEAEGKNVLSEFTFLGETVTPEVLLSLLAVSLTNNASLSRKNFSDQEGDVEDSIDELCRHMWNFAKERSSAVDSRVVQQFFSRVARANTKREEKKDYSCAEE